MTFVGKILVILIMAFSLFFLAISTVVFTTAENWKDQAGTLKEQIGKLQQQEAAVKQQNTEAEAALKNAADELAQQKQQYEARIAELDRQINEARTELTEQREVVATSQETARAAMEESEARKSETEQLREILAQVQEQSNEFKLRQTELNDEIRILQRQLQTAEQNNKDLRERVGLYSNVIRRAGLSDDIQTIRGVSSVPPDLEGRIEQVSPDNRRVVISLGSDDGLVVGHELELWRTQPTADYLGRIRIEAVEPNRAVGSVIGTTVQGKKIQEGDLVSSKIRPRS